MGHVKVAISMVLAEAMIFMLKSYSLHSILVVTDLVCTELSKTNMK
jgi:hypothetical protein